MSERWNRIKQAYQEVLARDPEHRAAYLREFCGDDEELRSEVESLLLYDEKAEARAFLESPAAPESDQLEVVQALAPGHRIGPYEVISIVGTGGMGRVYEATDIRLGRRVALKMLRAEMTLLSAARSRFLREARSAAALNHPNIAAIFDAGEFNGQLYLTMEFIQGKPLRALVQPGGLPEKEVIEYALQLASALDHAHSRGILHRDIKPENVLVQSGGQLKLVDFGIAKELPTADSEGATAITRPGMFVGTLRYAPPEVFLGGRATRQSDIYSFGVMLFEMACGQTPFEGLSPTAFAAAVLRDERPAVRNMNAAVSVGLEQIIARGIAREPAGRFSNAADMLAALRTLRETGAGPTTTAPTSSKALLALIEFVNLSRDPALDWLGTGIVETLDADLRKLGGIQITGRARTRQAVRALRTNIEDPASLIALGNRLGAKWIVTGSFQRSGNRIRVTPKVFKLPSGETAPTRKVDGVWEDLFEVQDRVVTVLLQALELEAMPSGLSHVRSEEAPPLDAYEHYASGRRCMNEMGRDSLAQAIQHFEKAVSLDSRYALAYAGLGSAQALTFIQTSRPEELQRAKSRLERAIELDAELGEPYPWLCYIYDRLGEAEKALKAGEKGVRLQPDLAIAHYFYAGTLIMGVEAGLGSCQAGLDSIMQCLMLDPRKGQHWMIAGAGALNAGHHLTAQRFFRGALHLERNPNLPVRFVGAPTMLGFAHSRQGDWDAARKFHRESLESLRDVQHVYKDVFATLSACGLGEIELRAGDAGEALTHFRHAWRLVKEEPRMLGNVRLGIRAQAGMAAAYATLAEFQPAERHLSEAASRMGSIGFGSFVWDTLLGQLHYTLASAQLRLGLSAEPIASLSRAIDAGFADAVWLETDPEWKTLHEEKDFRQLVERIHLIPPVAIDLSRLPSLEAAVYSEETAPLS